MNFVLNPPVYLRQQVFKAENHHQNPTVVTTMESKHGVYRLYINGHATDEISKGTSVYHPDVLFCRYIQKYYQEEHKGYFKESEPGVHITADGTVKLDGSIIKARELVEKLNL